MLRTVIALVLGCLVPAVAPATPMSFSDAWQALQASDDSLAAGEHARERAAALLSSSGSLFLPQIDLIGSYTRLEEPVELDALALRPLSDAADTLPGQLLISLLGGPDAFLTPMTRRDITRSALVAFWPLYTGGKITTARDIAALGQQEADALLEEIRRARFLELVSAYFGLVTAEKALASQRLAEQTLAGHLRAAEALEEQAQIAVVERLAVQAAYDQARIATRAMQEKRDIAQLALTRLVHGDSDVEPVSPLFIHPSLPALASFEPGLADHPGLRILGVKKAQAEHLARAGRGLYHPDVFMFGSYSVYEDDSLASELTPDWLGGGGVRLPLLDRNGRRGKVRAADSAVAEAGRLQQGAERRLSLLLESQYREARQALLEYRELASSVALAEQTLRLRERAFAEGLGRALDVVDAQSFLSATRTRRDAASFRYVLSLAQVLSLAGRQAEFVRYLDDGEAIQ